MEVFLANVFGAYWRLKDRYEQISEYYQYDKVCHQAFQGSFSNLCQPSVRVDPLTFSIIKRHLDDASCYAEIMENMFDTISTQMNIIEGIMSNDVASLNDDFLETEQALAAFMNVFLMVRKSYFDSAGSFYSLSQQVFLSNLTSSHTS